MIETLTGIRALNLKRSDLRRLAHDLIDINSSVSSTDNRLSDETVLKAIRVQNDESDERQLTLSRLVKDAANARGIHPDLEKDLQADEKGREQVSEHFWRRIVSDLSGLPWAFICNYAENSASAVHGDVHGISYGFHEDVTSWRSIVASGENSYVLFYNTVNAPENQRHYTAVARVKSIDEISVGHESSRRSWRASLCDFHTFKPVPFEAINIEGRNHQHGIQAITWQTLVKILELGGRNEPEPETTVLDSKVESEIKINHSFEEVLKHGPPIFLFAPPSSEIVESVLGDYEPTDRIKPELITGRRTRSDRSLDRLTENTAVSLVTSYLTALGWTLRDDCQSDGVGYDFEFDKEDQRILVEVKGIRGSQLAFNMTAKEWHVCKTRENFLLFAVTETLDSDKYKIHILNRNQIFLMKRKATQFRLS